MAKRDLASILDYRNSGVPTKSLDTAAKTASANGASIDLQDYRSLVAIIDCDAWTDGTHTFKLQDSDDDSTFSDVAAPEALSGAGAATVVIDGTADDDQAYIIGYFGSKRYVRAVLTVTSASAGAICGAMLIAGHPRYHGKGNMPK